MMVALTRAIVDVSQNTMKKADYFYYILSAMVAYVNGQIVVFKAKAPERDAQGLVGIRW